MGFALGAASATVEENVGPHQVDDANIGPNSGPAIFRGVWYPCLNIGWGAGNQR